HVTVISAKKIYTKQDYLNF
ncbi:hrcA C terminal domain protein, partial [Chlamydia psittaci 84-8471/1]